MNTANPPAFPAPAGRGGGVSPTAGHRPGDAESLLAWADKLGRHKLADGESLSQLAEAAVAAELARKPIPVNRLLTSLQYARESDFEWNGLIFRHVVLPLMKAAASRSRHARLLWLESYTHAAYLKQRETEEHFRETTQAWIGIMRESGRAAAAGLAEFPLPAAGPAAKLAFILPNACYLAHVEAMLAVLEGAWRLRQTAGLSVHCLLGSNALLSARLQALGVPEFRHESLHPNLAGDRHRLLLEMRRQLQAEGTAAAIYVSSVEFLPFAFSLRLAPVQIWWALKYHSMSLPEIDGYVTGGGLERFRDIDGRRWRNGLLGRKDWFDPQLSGQAATLRAALGSGKVILGVMGREEKMRDPRYLDAVTRILVKHPNALFLWCGRRQDAEIEAAFARAGVSDRTVYLGWINTRLFAQVFDVFLDTFPFPCGYTLYQSMAAGMPVVQLDLPETRAYGVAATILPLLEGSQGTTEDRALMRDIFSKDAPGDLLPLARTTEEYVELAGRLIEDVALRKETGMAGRRFVEAFFSNTERMAESYLGHFIEIIEGKAKTQTRECKHA